MLGAEGTPQLVAPEAGFAQAMSHLEMADRFKVTAQQEKSVPTTLTLWYCLVASPIPIDSAQMRRQWRWSGTCFWPESP